MPDLLLARTNIFSHRKICSRSVIPPSHSGAYYCEEYKTAPLVARFIWIAPLLPQPFALKYTFWVNLVVVVVVVGWLSYGAGSVEWQDGSCVAQYLRGTCCIGKLLHTFSTSHACGAEPARSVGICNACSQQSRQRHRREILGDAGQSPCFSSFSPIRVFVM